jgi:ATP-dependent HslUV protease subunit HslV
MLDTDKSAQDVAQTALSIAAGICVFTNGNATVEVLD